MEEKDLITLFKNVYRQTPDPAWQSRFRRDLWAYIHVEGEGSQVPGSRSQVFQNMLKHFFSGRLALAGVVLFFVLLFGIGSVFATESLLPSSPLYRLKLAIESAKGTFALSAEQKAAYGVTVAQKRVAEITKLSQASGLPEKDSRQTALIAKTLKRYSEALGVSSRNLKQLKAEGKTDIARSAARRLDETARAYTILLSAFDSATSVDFGDTASAGNILVNAETASREAQETAEEILQISVTSDDLSLPTVSPVSSIVPSLPAAPGTSTAASASSGLVSSLPTPSSSPSASLHPIPNVME